MKKLILALIIGISFASCETPGTIETKAISFIEIRGKIYDVKWVQLDFNQYDGIYLLIPRDSSTAIPVTVNFKGRSGKTNTTQAAVVIE